MCCLTIRQRRRMVGFSTPNRLSAAAKCLGGSRQTLLDASSRPATGGLTADHEISLSFRQVDRHAGSADNVNFQLWDWLSRYAAQTCGNRKLAQNHLALQFGCGLSGYSVATTASALHGPLAGHGLRQSGQHAATRRSPSISQAHSPCGDLPKSGWPSRNWIQVAQCAVQRSPDPFSVSRPAADRLSSRATARKTRKSSQGSIRASFAIMQNLFGTLRLPMAKLQD